MSECLVRRRPGAVIRATATTVSFVAVVVVAACGGDSGSAPTQPPSTPVGAYVLQSVNGKPLPVAIASDTNYTFEVTAGSLAFTSDGKYASVRTYRQTILGDVETFIDSTAGTWSQNGAAAQAVDSVDAVNAAVTWTAAQLTWTETDTARKVTTAFGYVRKPGA